MSADRQGAPIRQPRPFRAAGYVGAAAIILLVLIVPLPDVLQAVIYLLLFSVLPGGSLLIILDRTPSSPLLTLIASLVISIAIVMTTTLMMAYLELWAPVVVVVSIAVLSMIAGVVEFTRTTASRAFAELRSVGSDLTRSLRRPVAMLSGAPSRQALLEPMTVVLLVTDNADFEEAVSFALDSEDELHWQTFSLGSGLAPVRIAGELSRFAAVVLVIGPDVLVENAIELARHVRELASEVSIAVAAPVQAELFEEALVTGLNDVILPEWILRMSSRWPLVLLKPR